MNFALVREGLNGVIEQVGDNTLKLRRVDLHMKMLDSDTIQYNRYPGATAQQELFLSRNGRKESGQSRERAAVCPERSRFVLIARCFCEQPSCNRSDSRDCALRKLPVLG